MVLRVANKLLSEGRLSITQMGKKGLLYQAVDQNTAAKFRGLEREHMLVYQTVDKSGDKGIWGKKLRDETGVQQHALAKVVKELLRRQLIKEVKSVQSRGRKVYMRFDVEPDKSISGGTWYRDGEFATAWIESLRQNCLQFLVDRRQAPVTLDELHMHVQQQPGPSVPTQEDVRFIMRSLELEEEILVMHTASGHVAYCLRRRAPGGASGFDIFGPRLPKFILQESDEVEVAPQAMPCLVCPLAHECRVGGNINPQQCEYLRAWLQKVRQKPAADGGDSAPVPMDW